MYLRYSAAYSPPVMLPPQPHDSLPTPQYLTPKGSLSPLPARSSARESVPAGALQYDTQSWNSCGVPEPTFAARYGSAPTHPPQRMNSQLADPLALPAAP